MEKVNMKLRVNLDWLVKKLNDCVVSGSGTTSSEWEELANALERVSGDPDVTRELASYVDAAADAWARYLPEQEVDLLQTSAEEELEEIWYNINDGDASAEVLITAYGVAAAPRDEEGDVSKAPKWVRDEWEATDGGTRTR